MVKLVLLVFLVTMFILGSCSSDKTILNPEVEILTESGLRYVDIIVGNGASPSTGDRITVHWIGALEDGTIFGNTYNDKNPQVFKIGIGQLIKGWDEGVMTMKVGGKRKLIIPPELGYGVRGVPDIIPPNATLTFVIELLSVSN